MKTKDRLTQAYETARVEYSDDTSKYVILSDCHRGDGSCTFPSYITDIEIVGGQIQLVGWRVEADDSRYLHIVRRVLAGPQPLERYHLKAQRPGS